MSNAAGPSRHRVLLSLLASGALGACDSGPSRDLVIEPGVPWALAEHRRATLSDVRYAFDLAVPSDRASAVEGQVRITVHWSDPAGQPLVLDFLEPDRVRAARVNGQDATFEAVDEHVVVSVEGMTPDAENVIELEFAAGDGSLNRSDEFLYTLFVPERARYALPVFDQPNVKGRFAVTLTVPDGWTAVANGPLVSTGEGTNADGAPVTRFEFAESRPLPTYLFAFAAGRFQVEVAERAGRQMRLFHRETDREKVERNLEQIFDLHATALTWLEEYTGIEYPFQKFDFVGVPSFQYGGMEHAGAILYRASSLFLEESATQAQQLGRASLIAHETAHMWFGDLVTMDWFDDVWMKEVFANFMAAKIVNPSFPDINHDLRFLSHQQSAYQVDRTPGANPIRQPLDNLKDAGTLYGAIIYQKAPVVMNLLEGMVGEETFREALRHYLGAFSYDNATWPDLVEIMDVLSPEDVTAWSRVWVEDAGRPTVRAESPAGGQELTLVQVDPGGAGRLWPQDLTVMVGGVEGQQRIPVRLAGASAAVAMESGAGAPLFVLPESRAVGYARFELDAGSREYLLEHVTELEDPVARGVAWLTLWDAVLEGDTPPGDFLDTLLRGVAEEDDELNLQRILGFLESTYWRLSTASQRMDRVTRVEAALWARLLAAPTRTARSALFSTYRDVALSSEALARLGRIWAEEEEVPDVPLSESDRTTLAYELAVREVEGWAEILDGQAAAIQNPDRKNRFEFVRPALSADRAERDAFFASLGDPVRREQEPWVLTAVSYLNHPLRAEHALDYVLPSLELVEEIQRTGDIFFPKRWLDSTLGGHNSAAAAEIVHAFLDARPDYPPRLRAKVLQSADPLIRAAAILDEG